MSTSTATATAVDGERLRAAETFDLRPPHHAPAMTVTKRDGRREPVDLSKIVRAIPRCAEGLLGIL